MDKLAEYEQMFSKSRNQWTKAQWRQVAEVLASAPVPRNEGRPRKPGRPSLNQNQKDNIPALAFWADQVKEDARLAGKTITEREAIRRVMLTSANERGLRAERVSQKLESAIKQVRTFRQELKKRNSNPR